MPVSNSTRLSSLMTLFVGVTALTASVHAFDVELQPTDIPGFFYHPAYGAVHVSLADIPRGGEWALFRAAGYSGSGVLTCQFSGDGAPDSTWAASGSVDEILRQMPGLAGRFQLLWFGKTMPEGTLRADIRLAMVRIVNNFRSKIPADGPTRIVVPGEPEEKGRSSGCLHYLPLPAHIMEVKGIRLYTTHEAAQRRRAVAWGVDVPLQRAPRLGVYVAPGVGRVRLPTIRLRDDEAPFPAYEGQEFTTLRVTFAPTGQADSVGVVVSSGLRWVDSLLVGNCRRASLVANRGVRFDAKPTLEVDYVYTRRAVDDNLVQAWGTWFEVKAVRLRTE